MGGGGCGVSVQFYLKCRIAYRRLVDSNVRFMIGRTHLSTWVSDDTKRRFVAIANAQGLSESAVLKRLVEQMICAVGVAGIATTAEPARVTRGTRLSVRLQADDRLLLRERSAARGTPASTYVSMLVRAHLRVLTPLPKPELVALKRAAAELASVGRNLNQIARAANEGGRVTGPGREDLRAILKVCEGLRDNVRALMHANMKSWECGHAETPP
jgi:hypothetical protein